MQLPNRTLLRFFKKQVRLAIKAEDDLSVKNISFNLKYRKEDGGSVSVSLPDEKERARFAIIVHPLVSNDSEINVKIIAKQLMFYVNEEDKETISSIINDFEKLESGFIKIIGSSLFQVGSLKSSLPAMR